MKYFICENDKFKKVSAKAYEFWEDFICDIKLPKDILITNEDILYYLIAKYYGAVDKGEELLPFILFYYKDGLVFKNTKIVQKNLEHEIEYFKTLEDLKKRRAALIRKIKFEKDFVYEYQNR